MSTSPLNPDQLLEEALAHAARGEVNEAFACYRRILQVDPKHTRAHYKSGVLFAEIGRSDLAIHHLKIAHDSDPNRETIWVQYVRALMNEKRAGEARALLDDGMQRRGFSGGNVLSLTSSLLALQQAVTKAPERPVPLADVHDADFYKILNKAWPYSMSSVYGLVDAFYSLYQSVIYVISRNIPGAFLECGTYAGGMSVLAAFTFLKHRDTSRDLYLFDTFAGMPRPSAEDGPWVAQAYDTNTQSGQAWADVDMETVRKVMIATGYPPAKIHLIKGMVEDTIPQHAPDKISILRLDTDFYDSTRHELVHLYPRLAQGGPLIIDDYGYMPGARKAVDDYFASEAPPIVLNRINYTVRTGIKI